MHVWFLDTVHHTLKDRLHAAGMACHDGTQLTSAGLITTASQRSPKVEGLVLRSRLPMDAKTLEQLPDLRWIARSGSGLENIDLAWCDAHNVDVFSSPEGNRDSVGEHTLGMLLSLLHRIHLGNASVQRGEWLREAHRGRELGAMTVGIVGYGHMGDAFAQRLAGIGCQVLAYDKHKDKWGESPTVERPFPHVMPVGLETMLEEADVVSLHIPWTDETNGLVDDRWLEQWKKPIVLLNTSRGGIVRSEALLRALNRGIVTMAGLDVVDTESRSLEGMVRGDSFERLTQHERVLFTPHVAGWTQESLVGLGAVLADKVLEAWTAHGTKKP